MPELVFQDVQKRFGGTQALKGISFAVAPGEVVALLGENGAGKSTLIKILGGIHRADAGRILLDGKPYLHDLRRVAGAVRPVAFVHQDLGLIDWMTVAENVALANAYPRRGGRAGAPIDWPATRALAVRALAGIGSGIDPDARVASLSRTEKSLVAIARVLVTRCDVLVLDEPTASLPADEAETLFAAIRRMQAQGVGLIYVSHRLDEVFRIADRVVVLRDGAVVGERRVHDTTPGQLIAMIVGSGALQLYKKVSPAPTAGASVIEVRALATQSAGPVDFDIAPGEVLGIAGLRGAGHEEIGRALFGAVPHRGSVSIAGRALDLGSMQKALIAGVGLVARDRGAESVAPTLSIRENLFLNPGAVGRGLFSILSRRAEAARARGIGASVGLRPNDPALQIESLSGGNQQKVVIGRWLATRRRLLVLEDPTAGVDVGAKAEIYRLIEAAVRAGLAVVVVSTDFEEVALLCHRALVFNRGAIIAELAGAALTMQAVIASASASEAA